MFTFKQFAVDDSHSALKVTTDATLLGAWTQPGEARRVLDLGTGSGVVALMLAQRCGAGARILGIDTDEGSIMDAKANIANSPYREMTEARVGDAFEQDGEWDLVVCNPPFFTETLHSPDLRRAAARHAALLSPLTLPELAWRLLRPGGSLAFIAPTSQESAIELQLALNGLTTERRLRVRQRPGRPYVRTLWQAVKGRTDKERDFSELTINMPAGEPNPQFELLMSPYLLKY